MPRITVPPKNNIYTLLLAVTTVVFVIGLVVNGVKLSRYKNVADVRKAPAIVVPEIEAPSAAAQMDDEADNGDAAADIDFE